MRGTPYFAWVDPGEVFDPDVHARQDADIIQAVLQEDEGSLATVTVTTRPPEGGLLRAGMKRRCFISRERADGEIVLLASGKATAFPIGGSSTTVDIEFVCAPEGWEDAQSAVLEASKSGAHWDNVLVAKDKRSDPVEILDGLSSVVRFDPASGACTLTDIAGVGLPTMDIGEEWIDGSLQPSVVEPPISAVDVVVTAEWTQEIYGNFTFSTDFDSLTPDQVENRWPLKGDGLSGSTGYTVIESSLERASTSSTSFSGSSGVYNYVTDANLSSAVSRGVSFDKIEYHGEMRVAWETKQKRRETVKLRLTSGVQDVAIGQGGVRTVSLTCQDVTIDEVTPMWASGVTYAAGSIVKSGGSNWVANVTHTSSTSFDRDWLYFDSSNVVRQRWDRLNTDFSPIGGRQYGAYFRTTRGRQTLLAAAMRARAVLVEAMRCVEISVSLPVDDTTVGIHTGMCLTIAADGLLPGGSAFGKVTSRTLTLGADDSLDITIRCCIGSGEDSEAPSGSTWTSQTEQDWDVVAIPSFSAAGPAMAEGGYYGVTVINGADDQIEYVQDRDFNPGAGRTDANATDPKKLLAEVPTNVIISLVSLAAEDELALDYDMGTLSSVVEGPKQLDLAA